MLVARFPAPLDEPSAIRDFRFALRTFRQRVPVPSPAPAISQAPPGPELKAAARKVGTGARPWIALRGGRPLTDALGRRRRFASKAAALRAAERSTGRIA